MTLLLWLTTSELKDIEAAAAILIVTCLLLGMTCIYEGARDLDRWLAEEDRANGKVRR